MPRKEMVEFIKEELANADDYTIEQIYEFLLSENGWKEVIHISNREKGGMTDNQKKELIVEGLENMSSDVLELLYRIMFYAESGLE